MELAQQNRQANPDVIQQLPRLLSQASFAYCLHLLERFCDLELTLQPNSVRLLGVSDLSFPVTAVAKIKIQKTITILVTFANLLSSDSSLHAVLTNSMRLNPKFQAICHALTSRLLLYRYLAWQQCRPYFGTSRQQHHHQTFLLALTATDPILRISQLQTQSQLRMLQHSLNKNFNSIAKIELVNHWQKLGVAGLSSTQSILRLGNNSLCGQKSYFSNNLIKIIIDANDWQSGQQWLPGKQSSGSLIRRLRKILPPWLVCKVELRFDLTHLNRINLGAPTFLGWNSGLFCLQNQNNITVRKFIADVSSD